jgi:transposase InsO family protein
LYLAVVLELYSRKVVGWSMSERMAATLVCDALRMALFRRKLQIVMKHYTSVASLSRSTGLARPGADERASPSRAAASR